METLTAISFVLIPIDNARVTIWKKLIKRPNILFY